MNEYARIMTFARSDGRWKLEEVYFMNKFIASELVASVECGGSVDAYQYLGSAEDAAVAGVPEWQGAGVYYMPTGYLVMDGLAGSAVVKRRGGLVEVVLMPEDGLGELAELLESEASEIELNGLVV